MNSISTIGKKGEIILEKKEQEKAGIYPGDKVVIISKKNEIVIRKISTLKDLFSRKIDIPPLAPEEWEKERRQLRKKMMSD